MEKIEFLEYLFKEKRLCVPNCSMKLMGVD